MTKSNNVIISEQINLSKESFIKLLNKLVLYEKLLIAKNIVIKPNFAAGSYVEPNSHVVTDIHFLKKLVEIISLINKKATIYIAESDSTGYGYAFLKFEHLGLDKWQIPNMSILDVSRDKLMKVENEKLLYFNSIDKQLWLSEKLLNSDFTISLSNLKTHSVTNYTGACKNLFGLLPIMNKEVYHPFLNRVIFDLVQSIKVDLSIVDGFYAMEKNGPVNGLPINLGFRLFGSDPVEVDVVGCQKINLSPKKVNYLNTLLSKYQVEKVGFDESSIKVKPPGLFLRILNKVGLLIQKWGGSIHSFGHRIHTARSFLELIIVIIRPILTSVFDIQTLKKMKTKIMGDK